MLRDHFQPSDGGETERGTLPPTAGLLKSWSTASANAKGACRLVLKGWWGAGGAPVLTSYFTVWHVETAQQSESGGQERKQEKTLKSSRATDSHRFSLPAFDPQLNSPPSFPLNNFPPDLGSPGPLSFLAPSNYLWAFGGEGGVGGTIVALPA